MKIVVFAPHPDDETLGCGGTIARKVKEGYEVLIVILTDGRHSLSKLFGILSDPTPTKLSEVRKKEAIRATKVLGVREKNLMFFDFVDGMLKENEKIAQEKVDKILLENPDIVEVYFPYEKDCHLDHRVTSRIVRNSIKKLRPSVIGYRYTTMRTNAHIGPLIDRFFNLFRNYMIFVDVSELLPLKKAAMQEYQSQILIISNKQKRPVIDPNRFLKKKELFYI
jgi:LmbE family N-acetylglucosaminyl deacetylase